jgi:FG-GAP-like repeat
VKALYIHATVLPLMVAHLLAFASDGQGSHSLAFVESSTGLIPPTLDGGSTGIEMVDVNGDGFLDLVSVGDHGSPLVGTDQHGVMVWFGDGAGNWTLEMSGHFGYGGVALGDANNDGLTDVGYGIHHNYSATDFGDQLLEVALGDGSGRGWTPWDDGLASSGETWGMSAADFADVDGDGDLDLGSVGFGCCAGVHVYLNQGDGRWVESFGFLGGNARSAFVFGDVDGDGAPDIAVGHEVGTVYLGDGAGGFSRADGNLPPGGFRGHIGVALGDVDGDGADDLAFCNTTGGIEVWTMDQPGDWQSLAGNLPATGVCQATQLADMDQDGRLDVIGFGSGQGEVWGGDGRGGWERIASFSSPPVGDVQAFRVGGDTDHNGFPDVVVVAAEGNWPSLRSRLRVFNEASTASVLEIKPVYPRGRETFRAGSTVFVDWISAVPSPGLGRVDLELSTGGPGGPWQLIAADLPDNGRFQWVVPTDTAVTANAVIRTTLRTAGEAAAVMTPVPFSIVGGPPASGPRTRNAPLNRRRVPSGP